MASPYGNLPKLTVILAVRNAISTIDRAMESVKIQHYPKLELIVWDGMSNDGTQEALARHSDIITTLISESDNGPADACNRALSLATGDYIGYINADDEYEPGMLWAMAEAILKNPEVDVVTAGIVCRAVNRHGKRIVTGYYADERQLVPTLENVLSELPTFMLSRFIRREFTHKIGPWNTDRSLWFVSNDREWMTRLALTPCRSVVIPKALYSFEMHAKSISSNPATFTRIIDEHVMIAQALLKRDDLTGSQRMAVRTWQSRQLAFGFWKAFAMLDWEKARDFGRTGIKKSGWMWTFWAVELLVARMVKKFGLLLGNGIDRGEHS